MSIFSRLFKPNLDGEGIGEGIGEGVSGDVAYFAVGKQAANSQSSLDAWCIHATTLLRLPHRQNGRNL